MSSLISAVLFVTFYISVFLRILHPIQDPDVWWHLASGRDIVARYAVPHGDTLSWTAIGTPWVNSYWLYDISLYGLYTATGPRGVLFAHAAIVLLILFLVQRILIRHRVPWMLQLVALAALFVGGAPSGGYWGPQASLVSLLFFVGLLNILDPKKALSTRTLFLALPLVFLLWANLHRGFTLGFVALVWTLLERIQNKALSIRHACALVVLCLAATLMNPFGIFLYDMIRDDFFLSSQLITGWSPTALAHAPWLILTIIMACALTRKHTVRLLFLVLLAIASLKAIVFVPYFFCVAWIEIVSAIAQSERFKRISMRFRPLELALAVLVGIFLLRGIAIARPALGVQRVSFPVDLPAFIHVEKLSGRMYNDYSLGGFAAWFWGQRIPVFIDGRYPAVEGYKPLADQVVTALENPRSWNSFLESQGIDIALMTYREQAVRPTFLETMFSPQRWALVYWDDVAALYLLRIPRFQQTIQRFEYSAVRPDDSPATFNARIRDASPEERQNIFYELQRARAEHPSSQRIRAIAERFQEGTRRP